MERYTVQQRILVIKTHYQNGEIVAETVRKMRNLLGRNNAPSRSAIVKILEKFNLTGQVTDLKTPVRLRLARSKETIEAVRESVAKDPNASIPRRAQQLGISKTTLHRILTTDLKLNSKSKESKSKQSMSYKVEPLPDSHCELGEGPHWDVATQNLYFVDIGAGTLLRYDYAQNKVYRSKIVGEELAGFVVPIDGQPDKFAVGCGRRVVIVTWDGVSPTCTVDGTLFEVQPDDKFAVNRFNDGKCDPQGRLFAGTMRYVGDEFEHRWGELYKYEKGGKVEVVKSDVGISNGLAWNEKANKFYYIDTTDYEVKAYDYDFKTGVASNPKVVFNLRKTSPKDHLLPDGMTIDTDGNLYVATFNGHTIYKVDPTTGKVLLEIKFPCKQITSSAFGGPNLDILFVTTASKFGEPEPAGTTYKVTGLGAKGLPMAKLKK